MTRPTHPILGFTRALAGARDRVMISAPTYLSVEDQRQVLVELARRQTRLEALELKVLAAAERNDVGAMLIPAVLGGPSAVLDLGRERRLFSRAQRVAMALRDKGCRAEGCDRPPSWTEAHHLTETWADGGRTDLDDGILLCGHHHRLAHHPAYRHEQLPNGDLRYHRRT